MIIKLGNLTLGSVAIGGAKIGDIRKLSKSNFIKSKLTITPNNNIGIGGNVGGNSQWLLSNNTWNDNGVWDDTQNWTE